MKRIFTIFAAVLLPFLPLYSQELEIIPRFDIDSDTKIGESTSLYTLFSSPIGEHFEVLMMNHWVAGFRSDSYTKELYRSIGRSDVSNLFDYVQVSANFSNWTITLGKDAIFSGSFESDPWDVDCFWNLNSTLWNCFQTYQWGASVFYTSNSENTSLGIQMKTSPYGEKPFASGLFSYGAQWTGNYGWFSNIWSVSAVQLEKNRFGRCISLGQNAQAGDWTFGFIWHNASLDDVFNGNAFIGSIDFAPSEHWDILAKGGYETGEYENGFAGLALSFLPVDNLSIHATGTYNFTEKHWFGGFGVTWHLHIPKRQ